MAVLGSTSEGSEHPGLPRAGVRRDTIVNLLGNLSVGLGLWAVVAVLARAGSRELVGEYALALAVTSPAMQWANLQLRMIQATDTEARFGAYVVWSLSAAANGGALLLTWAAVGIWGGVSWWLVLGSSVAKVIDNFSEVLEGRAQRALDFRSAAMGRMLRSMVLVGGTIAVVGNPDEIVGIAIVLVTASASGWIVLRVRVRRASEETRPSAAVRQLIARSFPLGAVLFMVSAQQNVPRYFVEAVLGADALGLLAAVHYFTVSVSMVVQALSQATVPRVAGYLVRSEVMAAKRLLSRLLLVVMGLGGVAVAMSVVFGEWLLVVLYGPAFGDGAGILVVLMAAASLNFVSAICRHILTTLGRVRAQSVLLVFGLGLTSVGSLVGVRTDGLWGVAYALLGVSGFLLVVLGVLVRRAWRRL